MNDQDDSIERVMEDVHDYFCFMENVKCGSSAAATECVVQDMVRRAYELGGGSKGACQGADGAELAELRESVDGQETENDVLRFTLAKLRQGMEDAVDVINDTLGEEE